MTKVKTGKSQPDKRHHRKPRSARSVTICRADRQSSKTESQKPGDRMEQLLRVVRTRPSDNSIAVQAMWGASSKLDAATRRVDKQSDKPKLQKPDDGITHLLQAVQTIPSDNPPVHQPMRSPLQSPVHQPMRSPLQSPVHQPVRSPLQSPVHQPMRSSNTESKSQPHMPLAISPGSAFTSYSKSPSAAYAKHHADQAQQQNERRLNLESEQRFSQWQRTVQQNQQTRSELERTRAKSLEQFRTQQFIAWQQAVQQNQQTRSELERTRAKSSEQFRTQQFLRWQHAVQQNQLAREREQIDREQRERWQRYVQHAAAVIPPANVIHYIMSADSYDDENASLSVSELMKATNITGSDTVAICITNLGETAELTVNDIREYHRQGVSHVTLQRQFARNKKMLELTRLKCEQDKREQRDVEHAPQPVRDALLRSQSESSKKLAAVVSDHFVREDRMKRAVLHEQSASNPSSAMGSFITEEQNKKASAYAQQTVTNIAQSVFGQDLIAVNRPQFNNAVDALQQISVMDTSKPGGETMTYLVNQMNSSIVQATEHCKSRG